MSENISFWNGVTKSDGQLLSTEEQLKFCRDFTEMLRKSPELAKIFFNTQVYNEIVNDVTTRGAHSEGVAIVAENLARQKAILDGKNMDEAEVSALLAKALGYMHDLGHTPFGHDGEGALGNEMERFPTTPEYKTKRELLYGKEYQDNFIEAEVMCYEHNETSSTIGSRMLIDFAKENGYIVDEESLQYIKTGILAHSTSRVKQEPKGVEQKAVRLADKVAYIPQDLLDLLKQKVIKIDDLTIEEQGLLGLNENALTQKEQEEYDALTSDADKEKYKKDREQQKLTIKDKLRKLDKMPEKIKMKFFQGLDVKVAEMQAEIASKCFIERNGEYQLDGQKSVVDFFDKAVNKGKIPKNHEITVEEMKGISLFKEMRDAQKHRKQIGTKINENGEEKPDYEDYNKTKTPEEINQIIEQASRKYCEFLQSEYGMDSTMATLWVTKAKYQDAFINGELKRVSTEKDGSKQQETLADINKRNDNGWKMKSTFQYFYSNIDQIPEDFRQKYQGEGENLYTDQQLVSAFIASFTNNGLNDLYNGLVERNLVISREDAIARLQEVRPDLEISAIVETDKKWVDPQNPEAKYKVSANDVLEFLYEENVGNTIVSGKNQIPERTIPTIQHAIAVRDGVESLKDRSIERPECLTSLIDISQNEVTSQDIQTMVQSVRDRQNTQEIQAHISEVEQDERG